MHITRMDLCSILVEFSKSGSTEFAFWHQIAAGTKIAETPDSSEMFDAIQKGRWRTENTTRLRLPMGVDLSLVRCIISIFIPRTVLDLYSALSQDRGRGREGESNEGDKHFGRWIERY
jgi:hypothetical protein